jgi:hypothetical protein
MPAKNVSTVLLGGLVIFVGLGVGGCEPDPVTPNEFCDRWASAVCGPEVLSACQKSAAQCKASQAASCREWLPDDFQSVGVDECLDAVSQAYSDADLDSAELDVVWRLGAPCDNIQVTSESGETCKRDADCSAASGLSCVLKDKATGICERAELVKAGFACDDPDQTCERGFFCDGEHCIVAGEAGDRCKNDTQCGQGLFCHDERCETQLSVGADCTNDRQCESEICYEVDTDERVCVNRIRLSPAEPACEALK